MSVTFMDVIDVLSVDTPVVRIGMVKDRVPVLTRFD